MNSKQQLPKLPNMKRDFVYKINRKNITKYSNFILFIYCHYIIEIIGNLIEFRDINFNILLTLINNYITNIYLICISNNISLAPYCQSPTRSLVIIIEIPVHPFYNPSLPSESIS